MIITEELSIPSADPTRGALAWRPDRCLLETGVILVLLDAATLVDGLWAAQLVVLTVLLLLPGFLVLRSLRLSGADMLRSPGWLISTSLVFLMAIGLAVNVVGPLVGVNRPLTTLTLAIAVNLVCLGLAMTPGASSPWTDLRAASRRVDRAAVWSLVVPVLAAVGALRLNNGRGSAISLAAATAAVAVLALGAIRAQRWSDQRLGWLLFSATSALLLGYALRSQYVFGWDISTEYNLAQQTIADGSWTPAHPGDAYGAMLSLTILPAVLHALAGLSALVLLKVVFPLLFGLMPVVVFYLFRSALSRILAFLGAALLLTQLPFVSEMPALARQEIALLLFVSLLAAMLDNTLRGRSRTILLLILTAGVVVSHYSTTYTLTTVLAGAVIVQLTLGRFHGLPRLDPRKLVVLVAAVVLGFGWYQGVTKSTDHAVSTMSNLVDSGFQILPSADGESPLQAYLRGPKPPVAITVQQYQTDIAAEFTRDRPWVVPVQDATSPQWNLQAAAPQDTTQPSTLTALFNFAALVFAQALILATVGGTLALLLRRRQRGAPLEFAILALPSILLLGLVRLSSTLAQSYGQDRLYIQLLPIVAVPALWGLSAVWQPAADLGVRLLGPRWRQAREPIRRLLVVGVAALVLLLIAFSAGLQKAVVGDDSPANLFNGGEHYTRFYVTSQEVASAQWLAKAQPEGSVTYSDEYGQLRILGYGEPKGVILTDVTPLTVDANAWVYATRVNIVTGQARANYADQQLVYVFPADFLADQLGVVYTNGSSEVFHR